MRWDAEVGVIGAGPAGARAAELLAGEGAEVILWDPKAPWEKPCGGGLTAGTFREVPELVGVRGLGNRVEWVRLEAGDDFVEVPLDSPLYVVARRDLGHWQLSRAVQSGVRFFGEGVRDVTACGPGWQVVTAGTEYSVRRLVVADGAASRFRARVSPGLRIVRAAARVFYCTGSGAALPFVRVCFLPGLNGYLWDFPRPAHSSVGIGSIGRGWNRRHMDGALDDYLGAGGYPVSFVRRRAGATIGIAARKPPGGYASLGAENYAILGDAAGLADPLTGEGIRNALRSAACLVESFRLDGTFGSYAARIEDAFESGFRISRLSYRLAAAGRVPRILVTLGARSRSLGSLLAALLNCANGHRLRDLSVSRIPVSADLTRAA